MGVSVICSCNQSLYEFGHTTKVVILERCSTISASNGLVFPSFNFVVMENDDTDEEIVIMQNCFSQESLFPDFGLDILDKILAVNCQRLIISTYAKST